MNPNQSIHGDETARRIKIVQINMGRGRITNEELLELCQNKNVDVALVQEPYTLRGRMVGLDVHPIRTVMGPHEPVGRGRKNMVLGAAIVVFNPSLDLLARNDLSTTNFAVASIGIPDGPQYLLVSGYFKYRTPTSNHVQELRSITRESNNNIIIGADLNAFSVRWFSRITDHRGVCVEGLL